MCHCMLPRIAKGWARKAVAIDVQVCTEAKPSLALPVWWSGVEFAGGGILSVTGLLGGIQTRFY